MPQLLYSPSSPYSAKVRMAAAHAKISVESVIVDTGSEPVVLIDANPLGKIPVLVFEDTTSLYDSRAIIQWMNREAKNAMFPRNSLKRLEAEKLEALADGICDCCLAHVYERRFRPEDKLHQPWLDKQWSKVERALDHLNSSPPKLPAKINAGHIALRAAIGYLDLRFSGKWERKRGRLKRWSARFDAKFPDLAEFLPKG